MYVGVDVSEYNGRCDFKKAKANGVDFVIIKACTGAWSGSVDPMFETNYRKAKEAGMPVGVYVASYLNIDAELRILKKCLEGKTFEYPIFYDIESFSVRHSRERNFTHYVDKFCETVKSWGYYPGFYTNKAFYDQYLDKSVAKRWDFWIAHWNKNVSYKGIYPMQQYTNQSNFVGIGRTSEGGADANYCFVDYPAKIRKLGLNNLKGGSAVGTEIFKSKCVISLFSHRDAEGAYYIAERHQIPVFFHNTFARPGKHEDWVDYRKNGYKIIAVGGTPSNHTSYADYIVGGKTAKDTLKLCKEFANNFGADKFKIKK